MQSVKYKKSWTMNPCCAILWYILACVNAGVEAVEKEDVDIVRDIVNLYNYDCVALAVNGVNKKHITDIYKTMDKKIAVIDTSSEESLSSSVSSSIPGDCLIFANDADGGFDKLLQAMPSMISKSNLFVRTDDIESIVARVKDLLRFDSNFNLVVKVAEDNFVIKEVYSPSVDNLNDPQIVTYGQWKGGNLVIDQKNMVDRRTDLGGITLK